jgi:hypothetical protein
MVLVIIVNLYQMDRILMVIVLQDLFVLATTMVITHSTVIVMVEETAHQVIPLVERTVAVEIHM